MFGVEKFWVEKFGLKCPDPNTVAAVLLSTDSNMYDDSCLILSYTTVTGHFNSRIFIPFMIEKSAVENVWG